MKPFAINDKIMSHGDPSAKFCTHVAISRNPIIFEDNFENGNFDKWTTHNSNWSIATDDKKNGIYSVKRNFTLSANILDKTFLSSKKYIHFSFEYDLKLVGTFVYYSVNTSKIFIIDLRKQAGNIGMGNTYLYFERTTQKAHFKGDSDGVVNFPNLVEIEKNKWYHIQANYNWQTKKINYLINGVDTGEIDLTITSSGAIINSNEYINRFYFNNFHNTSPNFYLYLDNFKMTYLHR